MHIVMFRDCPFCGARHQSPYVDELEEMVLSCRETVSPEHRGSLEFWMGWDMMPRRPETERFVRCAA